MRNRRSDGDNGDTERIVIEPTKHRDREITQQLEQVVDRVRRAREVLDQARGSETASRPADAEHDTDRLARTRSIAGSRVMLVDDEDVIRRLMARMIEGHGCTCSAVPSGEEAIPLLETEVFDLLIFDKNLPGMSGIEIAKAARRYQPGVPVLLITGYASEESAREAAAYGVTDYVLKPIDLEDFRHRMIHALTADRRGRTSYPDLGRGASRPAGKRKRGAGRGSRPSMARISRPPAPGSTKPLNVVVLLCHPDEGALKELEGHLKPVCSQVQVFAERSLAESFARSAGFDVLIAAPDFITESFSWWGEVPGREPLGTIAIMERSGIDKAIEAIQLGARGSLHPPFDQTNTQFEFRRAVTALIEERRRR